ncbi:hypothetical protein [Brevibacillus borstelensis]|uniref:hypothetical protein n=1 Tax=Brevibacillus borstelensis TaxID=45462 RepID=UPI0030BA73E4
MNVYEINGHFIAAESANQALDFYLEETNFIDEIEFGEMPEGEMETISISCRRVPDKELVKKDIPCCEDGCARCDDLNDYVYDSLQDVLDKSINFPCTLAVSS